MKKYILFFVMIIGIFNNRSFAINYDLEKVSNARIGRNNDFRNKLGLVEYTYDDRLNDTAKEWSIYMSDLGNRTHKRFSTDGFYNYKSIGDWFENRGLEFANVSRTTYTENVGVGYVRCKDGDCTDEVINAIRSTRNMYIREGKGGAHYNSLINKNFRLIGFGLDVNKKNKYYLTIHYGTKILDTDKKINPTISKKLESGSISKSKSSKVLFGSKKPEIAKNNVNISELDKWPIKLN